MNYHGNHPARTHPFQRSAHKQAYALIVAISLMAFLVLLLLSLTTLVQVELSTTTTQKDRHLVRENARLALLMAIGDLQKHAGPDQRVTARAEIFENIENGNRYWTGVWDASGTNPNPHWLVSGLQPDPGNNSNEILMVGPGSVGNDTSQHVYANSELITAPTANGMEERIAYWVGDEGLKSSLVKRVKLSELVDHNNPNKISDLELKRVQQITPNRPKNEIFFSKLKALSDDPDTVRHWEDEIASKADNISFRQQLNLIEEFGSPDPLHETSEVDALFHDVTVLSLGVLADTENGELKRDLTDTNIQDAGSPFPINSDFRSFLSQRINGSNAASMKGPSDPITLTPGTPINPVAPITTEFGLYFGLFRKERTSPELKLEVYYRSDIWNPYSVNLNLPSSGEADYYVRFKDLPTITISWRTGIDEESGEPATTGIRIIDPNTLEFENKKSDMPPLYLDSIPLNTYTMRAGENRTASARGVIDMGESIDFGRANDTSDDEVTFSAPQSVITMEILTIDGELIQRFENVEFKGFTSQGYIRARKGDPSSSDFHCVFHAKFNDSVYRPDPEQYADLEKWSSTWDVRQLIWSPSKNADHQEMIFVSDDPEFAIQDQTIFAGPPQFFRHYNQAYYRFFDFPTTAPISVGYLNHLAFHEEAPFAIGNPWGLEKNRVFDRYFFSTVPRDGETRYELPNHHLTFLESSKIDHETTITSSDHAASHFLIQGAFNINSTSVDAWKAILSGIQLYDWGYRVDSSGNAELERAHVKNGMFRFPFGADLTYLNPGEDYPDYPEVTQTERSDFYKTRLQPDWMTAYSLGMRELRNGNNASDPIDDVTDLATAIVQKLKARGKPFSSLKEFANSAIIQEALDATKINTIGSQTYESENDQLLKFPRYSPSFVSQADVLNLLAPFSLPRSDTFTIRGYGEIKDTLNPAIVNRAWCEAIVQRIPEPHEFRDIGDRQKTLEDYRSSPSPLGRKFRILNFRWLSEEEI